MTESIDPAQLWLGACVGAQVLVVVLSVIQANAYRDRSLLLHAAATLMGVVVVQVLLGRHALLPSAVFLLVPSLAGLQLLDLVSHAGGLRQGRRWLLGVSALVLPLLAVIAALYSVWAMAAGLVLWTSVVLLLLARAWRQSQPWVWWLPPGLVALAAAGFHLAVEGAPFQLEDAVLVSALLALWSAATFVGTGWRDRIFGETRIRLQARNTIDPLTGLGTPLVLHERVLAARHLTRRYGHPSVLMLVNIDNLGAIATEFGLEAAESAVLAAASRVRESLLRDGDVAARLAHARIGVLAEGVAPGQAAATVAGRILVAGLKEPLPAAPAEFLRFRIVLVPVPTEDVPPKLLLQRLNARLDQEVREASDRRIVTLTPEELLP
ncbi:MAG: regulator protein domain, rane protein-like protein [Ramlibacter sp.]|jgi:GGDEF domain-containing protein|nr:regulator protein domain, rane protein-like protein [Ramlibacter sp.]